MISLPPNAYNHRTLFNNKHVENKFGSEGKDFLYRNADFTQSGIYPQQERPENQAVDFFQSVQVVPTSSGGYKVYSSLSDNRRQNYRKSPNFLLEDSQLYGHNISNPDLWKLRFNSRTPIRSDRYNSRTDRQIDRFHSRISEHPENESSVYLSQKNSRDVKVQKNSSLKETKYSSDKTFGSTVGTERVLPIKPVSSRQKNIQTCNCGKYHCHKFDFESGKRSSSQKMRSSIEESITHKLTNPLQQELSACNEKHVTICNTFWKPFLAFSEYKHGQKLIQFKDLWPNERIISDLLKLGIENAVLRDSIPDLCLLAVVCGPVDLLKALLNMSLIRVDYQLDNDASLLHLACLVQNHDMVQYLVQSGVSPNIRDKSGKTADQVCISTQVRKSLPAKYLHSEKRGDTRSQFKVKPSLQDKDVILRLTMNHKNFYELHKKLQTFDLNINTECTAEGDFLLHRICRGGLCQLIHIHTLVMIHNAAIELCNADGMTPLMIVAEAGDSILCEILLCVFGADPNKPNCQNGKSALHYAVQNNHIDVVNSLIKRGADVNQVDHQCCLPDDLPKCTSTSEDSREIIKMHRTRRHKQLEQAILKEVVYLVDVQQSDLSVVNEDDLTLVMVAAKNNKVENLKTLIGTTKSTIIDAQHRQTGMTALAMAAKEGYSECVRVLLKAGARPAIQDMQGYLPLHHAILHNQEETVEAILEFFPETYIGLFQGRKLCKKSSIHQKIKAAWDKRQEEIVTPELRVCAISGNAESMYCLLEEGDKVDTKSDLSNLPAVFLAVENGQLEVLKLLQEKGASMRQRHPQTGSTLLHLVAKTGNLKIARYLLQFCSNQTSICSRSDADYWKALDINALNNENKTALQVAAEKGFIHIVDVLIDNGATVALLDSQGELFSCAEYEGVRMKIHTFRDEHTKQIMNLIMDKSKKAFQQLPKLWLPKFDHNLRDKNGDTPLMVACRQGRLHTVRFLLESAVYKHWMDEERCSCVSCDDHSDDDADSGVPDMHADSRVPDMHADSRVPDMHADSRVPDMHADSRVPDMHGPGSVSPQLNPFCTAVSEIFLKSFEKSQDLENQVPEGDGRVSYDIPPEEKEHGSQLQANIDLDKQSQLHMLLQDVRCPKGCSIYHDGIVSHVCAKNLFDGCTPLHRAVEGGDNSDLVLALVETDRVCLNMQSDAGLTAVHLACKLGRKKVLAKLLEFEDLDISVFTLNGQLPEEMTSNKTIIKMVQKARKGQPVIRSRQKTGASPESLPSLTDSLVSSRANTTRGSDINFDNVFSRFQTLRQEVKTKME
ncbi:hypothetical protein CHS0354_024634 [Potamilus streckersoni]|uniref:Uncharacterized protein n=1 Tax=Potamilus streckersoni TaxID=2493646 RepID=A0AAE0W1U6_9BIVA|nr:hypothetical protein CHS0354_024634 [Potamilus streckersoni]